MLSPKGTECAHSTRLNQNFLQFNFNIRIDKTILEQEKTLDINPANVKTQVALHGELIQGTENILKLSQAWDNLFSRAENAPVYLSRAWIQTFIDEGHYKGKLCFIAVWRQTELAALLPLDIQNVHGIRIGRLISSEVPSYLGLLLDPEYPLAVSIVAETWIKEKVAHVFHDKFVSSFDKATQSLVTEFNRRGFKSKYGYERICYGIELGCSFDEYFEKYKSAKSRQTIRRKERKLLENKNVKVEYYSGSEINPDVLKRIAQIQEESWLKKRGASILKEPFYEKLLTQMAMSGFGSIWLMTIDGDDAAFVYGSINKGTFDYQWPAFKLKYESEMSVGQILLMQIIREVCEKKIRYFEFGHGEGEYKKFWSNNTHKVLWVIAGRGILGNIAVYGYQIAWRLAGWKLFKSLYKKIRR